MKKILIMLAGILVYTLGIAQEKEATISWENTVIDLGTFKEEDGVQTVKYNFTNTGNSPLFLTNVRAGCGCTTPEWTRDPIQPGESGFVKIAYNPRNRPGTFNRSATVTTNATQPTTVLRIKGNVIGRERGIEDDYPRVIGGIRLKTSHQAFANVKNTQVVNGTIEVVNMSDEDVKIEFQGVPSHIEIEAKPNVLKGKASGEDHGQKGEISIKYDATEVNEWGFKMDRIFLVQNGERDNTSRLSISATIVEDFSHLSEDDLANAPRIEFDETEFDFGTLKSGERIDHNFVFKNTGKSDLIIRRIRAACGCTATNPEKMVLKPGETSHITVTFNSRGQRGNQNRAITVITNDPKESSTVLRVRGRVDQ